MTQYGSFQNLMMDRAQSKAPEVGEGATILMYSDRHAATIVEVSKSGKRVGVVEDEAIRIDNNGMSDSQQYRYERGTGPVKYFTLRKNGRWVREKESMKGGQVLMIGARMEYYDYTF